MNSLFVIVFVSCTVAIVLGEKTACQRSRERQLSSSSSIIIHKCKENGDYESLQSYENSNFKICLYKDGDVVYGPTKGIEQCNCFEKRYELIKSGELTEDELTKKLPACTLSGYFVSLQTDGTDHWCVNPQTGEETTPRQLVSREINCS